MKSQVIIIFFSTLLICLGSSVDNNSVEVQLAKSNSLGSSQSIQAIVRVKVKGVTMTDGGQLKFGKDLILAAPSMVSRSGEGGHILIIKEYEADIKGERPFTGIKLHIKPTIDFFTGKITHTGKVVFSEAKQSNNSNNKASSNAMDYDFKSWTKYWACVGNHEIALKVGNGKIVKVQFFLEAVDATGRKVIFKQAEHGAEQPATGPQSKSQGNKNPKPESKVRSQ